MKARFELRKGCLISDIQENVELLSNDENQRNEFVENQKIAKPTKDYFSNEIRVVDDERTLEEITSDLDRFFLNKIMELPKIETSQTENAYRLVGRSVVINGMLVWEDFMNKYGDYFNDFSLICTLQNWLDLENCNMVQVKKAYDRVKALCDMFDGIRFR